MFYFYFITHASLRFYHVISIDELATAAMALNDAIGLLAKISPFLHESSGERICPRRTGVLLKFPQVFPNKFLE